MRRRVARAAAVAALLLPHHLPAAPMPAPRPADVAVAIDNFTFKSARLTVPAGTRVVWTNRDDIPHTVTAEGVPPAYRSHPLDSNDSYAMVFDHAGVYAYFCSLHPKMRGTVIVR